MFTDEDVFAYVQSAIPSVWALELLRAMARTRDRAWHPAELVTELRSSPSAVADGLAALHTAGLVAVESDIYRFHPASDAVGQMAARILELYAVRPAQIIRAIMAAPNAKLRLFANSFRLKE